MMNLPKMQITEEIKVVVVIIIILIICIFMQSPWLGPFSIEENDQGSTPGVGCKISGQALIQPMNVALNGCCGSSLYSFSYCRNWMSYFGFTCMAFGKVNWMMIDSLFLIFLVTLEWPLAISNMQAFSNQPALLTAPHKPCQLEWFLDSQTLNVGHGSRSV